MDKIVALSKRRGFIFPASEIYGGIANTYDYGHYGVLLKNNVIGEWWKAMIQERDDVVALDSAIIQHPRTWEASGHLEGFTDPLSTAAPASSGSEPTTCRRSSTGVGNNPEIRCGHAPSKLPGQHKDCDLTEAREFNLMFETSDRPGEGRRIHGLPAPRDRPGHIPQLQEHAPVRPPQAAVRDRPGGQVVPQRDHAGQLRLSHARVRADGDGVLRAPGRGRAVAPALDGGSDELVRRAGARPREAPPARARARRAVALLLGHERHRVPLPDRLV